MKRVKNSRMILLVSVCLFTQTIFPKKCHNLIMLLDPAHHEKVDGAYFAMGIALITGLQQKAAPIIITPNILFNFCYWQTNATTEKQMKQITDGKVQLSFINSASLDDTEWHGFMHEPSSLILLVPKAYAETHAAKNATTTDDILKECGFNANVLKKIKNVSSHYLLGYLDAYKKTPEPEKCSSLFMPAHNENTWNIYLAGHGNPSITLDNLYWPANVAGLTKEKFHELIRIFTQIDTSYLHYLTCFSGGNNQYFVKEVLESLKVPFIVSTQGINESSTYQSSEISFTEFFSLLNNFFEDAYGFTQRIKTKKKPWHKDPLASIVSTIMDDSLLDYNQPFIYVPPIGLFNALRVDESVKILTNTIAKAHEFEGKTIEFLDSALKTVIIYPHLVGVPIKIKQKVALVAPVHQNIPTTKKDTAGLYVFEHIDFNDALSSVISNFVSFNSSRIPITFVIKKLECKNNFHAGLSLIPGRSLTIENMIISLVAKPGKAWDFDVDILVLFTYNNTDYYFSLSIDELSKNSALLFSTFRKLKASILSEEKRLSFLPRILNEVDVKEISRKKITLSAIVEKLEQKVDTPFRVQKIGALKKVLLKKQEDIQKRKQSWSELFNVYVKQPVLNFFKPPKLDPIKRIKRAIIQKKAEYDASPFIKER